jgi:hypothetical protein
MDMMFFFFDQVFEGADSGAPTHSLKRILEKPYSCFFLLKGIFKNPNQTFIRGHICFFLF